MKSILYTNKHPNDLIKVKNEHIDEIFVDSGQEKSWGSINQPVQFLKGYQSIAKRKILMDKISKFIIASPLFVSSHHSSINLLEVIRYTLFFKSEKYNHLISIIETNKHKKIRFEVLGYDLSLLLKLFKNTHTVQLSEIRFKHRLIAFFRSSYNLLKSILLILIKWIKKTKLDNKLNFNDLNYIFVESSLRNVSYSDEIASELSKKGNSTLLIASILVQNQTRHFTNTVEPIELLGLTDIWKIIGTHIKIWRWYKRNLDQSKTDLQKRAFLLISFNMMLDAVVWQHALSSLSNKTQSKLISTSIAFSGTRAGALNFKLKKLKTYLIQHGITFTFDFEKYILQEYQLMWGDYNRKQLVKYGFDSNKIYTIGSIKFGESINLENRANNYIEYPPIIFFPSRTAGAFVTLTEAQLMLKSVLSLVSVFPDINLKIKPHPEDNSFIFDNCKELLLDNKVKSLDQLQEECFVIVSTSTVGLEACCLGKDLIVIENDTIKDVTGLYRAYGAALIVRDELELHAAIEEILSNDQTREKLNDGRLRLVKDMFNASNKSMKSIQEILIETA